MIIVLKIGHRKQRDARVSTHCGLVARAFGAEKIIYSGEHDEQLIDSIKKVVRNWGGPFSVEYVESWIKIIKQCKRKKMLVIHLSIYGKPLQNKINEIRRKCRKDLLVIVGSEKVPGEVYKLSDLNIGVTQQPHSEVAALAIFLHEYFQGKEFGKKFRKARIKVIPQEHGKKVIRISR